MKYVEFDASRPLDIIPLGRACIDFIRLILTSLFPKAAIFIKYVGGSPANIAVGMARLGKKSGFIGRVSDDQFGDYVIDYFKNDGIDTSHIFRAKNGEKLGLTFTEILSPTESSILMYRDTIADLTLDPSEVDEDYIKSAKALLISGTSLCQSPSREAALKAMELAKKTNTVLIFDIDYRPYNWKSKDEIAVYYSTVGKNSDIIMGSKEEFNLMEALMVDKEEDDAATAARWHKFGAKIVIIKHGKQGSTAYTNDGLSYSIKPFPVDCLKSFGGGDGYGSAFLTALMEGWEMMDALEFGSASASMLVSAHSCSAAMPKMEEVKEFIRQSKEKYGEMVARG